MKHLRRLWPYVRRLRRRYALGLLLVAMATLSAASIPVVIKYAIDGLKSGATRELVLMAAGAIVLFAVLRSALVFGGRNIILTSARQIEYELRNDLYRHLLRLPASYYDRQSSGDVTSRIINDLDGIRMLVGIGTMSIVGTGLMFVTSLSGMFLIDWKLALLCLIPLSLVSIVSSDVMSELRASWISGPLIWVAVSQLCVCERSNRNPTPGDVRVGMKRFSVPLEGEKFAVKSSRPSQIRLSPPNWKFTVLISRFRRF
jgi:ATP-binding cassette subfamily B protein